MRPTRLVAVRRVGIAVLSLALILGVATPAHARAYWERRIDRIIRRASIGVAVRLQGDLRYTHNAFARRVPASNEKLLVSMAILHELGPGHRMETSFRIKHPINGGVVDGNLWIQGRGDPTIADTSRYAHAFPFKVTRVRALARSIASAGVTRITGRVFGSPTYFAHDWFAQGWESSFPAMQVALPSALVVEGNSYHGRHISDPEKRAAQALTRRLKDLGVRVAGKPGARPVPPNTIEIASVESPRLEDILSFTNRWSSNFFAEMLGKLLGVEAVGRPGTIAKGAAAIEDWARRRGVHIEAFDSSGLSYANRISPVGLVKLLEFAAAEGWGDNLRRGLPKPGQGTLMERLAGFRVRAKTGTLSGVSTLSGWVWSDHLDEWIEFSIMCRGLSKTEAVERENAIVRVLARYSKP